ncbi:MAG: hypothetical protein AAGH68_16810 [Pseudomonadota bacterium]
MGIANAAPLNVFQDCDECPEMVELPLGSFIMGTDLNEVRRAWFSDSSPESIYQQDDP